MTDPLGSLAVPKILEFYKQILGISWQERSVLYVNIGGKKFNFLALFVFVFLLFSSQKGGKIVHVSLDHFWYSDSHHNFRKFRKADPKKQGCWALSSTLGTNDHLRKNDFFKKKNMTGIILVCTGILTAHIISGKSFEQFMWTKFTKLWSRFSVGMNHLSTVVVFSKIQPQNSGRSTCFNNCQTSIDIFNPFHANGSFLSPLKTSGNLSLSGGTKMEHWQIWLTVDYYHYHFFIYSWL